MSDLPKLHYFPIAGRAEPIRLACALGGIKYEEWGTLKSTFPFGAIPVWEEPGKKLLPQSNAILRYIGKQTGLYPADNWEAALVDAILDAIEEISSVLSPSLREKDEQKKLEMRAVLASTTLPNWFSMLDKYLANLSDSYCVGSSLTIADLKLSVLIKWIKSGVLDGIPGEIVDPFPRLVKVNELVQEDKRVKAYCASKAK